MSSSVEITPELLQGFLDEAPEYLQMLDEGLMALEERAGSGALTLDAPEDQERMNTMFRAAHSLKGLAAAFGFDRIKELTHRMETLFDHVRMRKRDLSSESFETLFRVFDRLKALVAELSDPSKGPIAIEDVLAELDKVLSAPTHAAPVAVAAAPVVAAAPAAAQIVAVAAASSLSQNEIFADPELASLFVATTTESLDELNQGLLGLEKSPADKDILNTIFRCAHNIKGASGAAGLSGMNRLTHDMETVLDQLRQGAIAMSEELMNGLFRSVDRLKGAIERIRAGHIEDLPAPEAALVLPEIVIAPIASPPTPAAANEVVQPTTSAGPEDAIFVDVMFPDGCDEAPIRAYLIYNKLGECGQVLSTEPNLDNLAGDSVLKKVRYEVRTDTSPVTLSSFVTAYGVESVQVVGSSDPVAVPAARPVVAAPAPQPQPAKVETKPVASTPTKPAPAPPKPTSQPTPPPPAAAKNEAVPVKAGETLRVDQERLDQLMNLGGELVINRARFVQIHGKFREVFDGKNLGYLVDDMSDRMKALDLHVDRLAKSPAESRGGDDVRDNLLHLSQSFNTVRGLVQRVHELRTSMFDFDEALHSLTRVTDGIQKGIMGTRMVPIGPLFTRFRRVVRDIAKTNGKQVELVLHGENTELDKRMIDELGDPLTHMVRNSVDHGLESPEVRVAAGKDPTGTVTLEASHRGNSICIEVKDDGAGINLERVRKKIVEREMATPAQVEKMSDRELISHILKPGFSTAPVVTDLSGRGMGMDIVISKIEKLSGTVEVDSVEGQGTHVTIKLPLTLAILKSLVAKIGDGIYAVPLETVAEIITVKQSDIHSIHRRRVVRVREQIIPVVMFEDVFQTDLPGLRTATRDQEEMTLVIVGFEREKLGLVVDSLKGQEDVVIKSIAENFRNVRGIAGASIRGDGTVSLILDVGALMDLAAKSAAQAIEAGELVAAGRES